MFATSRETAIESSREAGTCWIIAGCTWESNLINAMCVGRVSLRRATWTNTSSPIINNCCNFEITFEWVTFWFTFNIISISKFVLWIILSKYSKLSRFGWLKRTPKCDLVLKECLNTIAAILFYSIHFFAMYISIMEGLSHEAISFPLSVSPRDNGFSTMGGSSLCSLREYSKSILIVLLES